MMITGQPNRDDAATLVCLLSHDDNHLRRRRSHKMVGVHDEQCVRRSTRMAVRDRVRGSDKIHTASPPDCPGVSNSAPREIASRMACIHIARSWSHRMIMELAVREISDIGREEAGVRLNQ